MEDTLRESDNLNRVDYDGAARELGDLLIDHKGADVIVLDLRKQGAWTDFFVIATAGSDTHMDGMERHVKEFCRERGIEILRRSRKPVGEDEWRVIDLGAVVIHLMSRRAWEFYDLERLYSITGSLRGNPETGLVQ